MNPHEQIIRKYYQWIEANHYEELLKLFSKNATIVHPIFGNKPAVTFFNLLKQATASHKIRIYNLFTDPRQPGRIAVYFTEESAKSKEGKEFGIPHGVHIFDLSKSGAIEKITVIFDTYPLREILR